MTDGLGQSIQLWDRIAVVSWRPYRLHRLNSHRVSATAVEQHSDNTTCSTTSIDVIWIWTFAGTRGRQQLGSTDNLDLACQGFHCRATTVLISYSVFGSVPTTTSVHINGHLWICLQIILTFLAHLFLDPIASTTSWTTGVLVTTPVQP